jgi:hypothetical protein
MGRVALACVVLALAPSDALAQTSAEPSRGGVAAQRNGLHDQAIAVTALYLASAVLGAVSTAMVLISWNDTPSSAYDHRDEVLALVGIGAGVVGFVVLVASIFLDADRHVRRDALAHALSLVRLGPGGLALAF